MFEIFKKKKGKADKDDDVLKRVDTMELVIQQEKIKIAEIHFRKMEIAESLKKAIKECIGKNGKNGTKEK